MTNATALRALAELAAILEEVEGPVVLWLDAPGRVHCWRIAAPLSAQEEETQPVMPEHYLSAKEVAAHLDVSERSVWRWVKEGLFPAPVHWKKLSRWPLSVVERFARQCQEQPQGEERVESSARGKA